MYPTIPYLIKDLTGVWVPIPIATFGLFLVISIYSGAFFFKREIIRKEKEGWLSSFKNNKGISQLPHEIASNLIIISILWGLIGARVFSILEYPKPFIVHPFKTLFSMTGLTFYGGLIFGSIAGLYYVFKRKLPLLPLLDATAPALMLSYAIGRIGCQLAGDGDWGIDNLRAKPEWLRFLPDWIWAYRYPHNVIEAGVPIIGCSGKYCFILSHPVYPTPLYEIAVCLILFGILWYLRKKINLPGILFSLYLIVNGMERVLIERIRVDSEYTIFHHSIKQAEIIGILFIFSGLTSILILKKRGLIIQ